MKKFRTSRPAKRGKELPREISAEFTDPGTRDDAVIGSDEPHGGQLRSIYDDEVDERRRSGALSGNERGSFQLKELAQAALVSFKALRFTRKAANSRPDRVRNERPAADLGRKDIPEADRIPSRSIQKDAARSRDGGGVTGADVTPAPRRQRPRKGTRFSDEDGWLVAQNLAKSFRRRPVVRDVTLAVRQGEAVGLLGPNGAGKTTVFYMITGLIRPDQGGIRIDGFDVTSLPMYSRARLGVGYLPQETSIFRGLSVEDNIKAVLEIVEPDRRQRKQDLERLLQEFGIEHLRKSPSIALSGGERRRCEIARALASRPAFMLLDEPFAGIDPIAVGDIQQLVRQLTARGIGVLITDHNVRETLGLIDRAYIIHSGEVLMEGTPDDIVRNEDVRRVYLGDQFTL